MTAVANEVPKTPEPITARQREVYDWIVEFVEARGYSPTVRELCKAFGFASPTGAVCHLKPLQERGWISWVPHHSRTIRPIGGTK